MNEGRSAVAQCIPMPMFDQPLRLPPGALPSGSALRWAPEGAPAAISIDYDVIDRLGAAVMEGFGRVPKRGAEVGGILLGSIEDGDIPLVRIIDFVAVPVEYRWGPSYQLSDEDLQNFDTAIAEVRQTHGTGVEAVGYFRSHTREPFQMIEDDVAMMGSRFPRPFNVCLLIRPHRTQPSSAVFLFRQDGVFNTAPLTTALPFRRSALGGGRTERRRDRPAFQTTAVATPIAPSPTPPFPATPPLPAVKPEPAPEPQPNWVPRFGGLVSDTDLLPREELARLAAARGSRWIGPTYAIAMLLLGLLSGAWLTERYLPRTPVASDPTQLLPMELDAQIEQSQVVLRWKLPAALERDATNGALRIVDGLEERIIELSRADLLQRALRFRPVANGGSVKLEIRVGARNSVSESTIWTSAAPLPAVPRPVGK